MGTKVRVLVDTRLDGILYPPNTVLDLPKATAKTLERDGAVDSNADAVAYCVKELGAPVVVHEAPKAVEDVKADEAAAAEAAAAEAGAAEAAAVAGAAVESSPAA